MLVQSVLFSKEECDHIIGLSDKYSLGGSNGRYDNIENFKYKYYTIDKYADTEWIIKRLFDFFEYEKKLKIYPRNFKLNMHHYTVGDQFGKHIDTGYPIKEWNIGIQLNDNYTGGNYNIYDTSDNPVQIDKKTGNVSIYQSQTPHEVTPVIEGERWSIAVFATKNNVYSDLSIKSII